MSLRALLFLLSTCVLWGAPAIAQEPAQGDVERAKRHVEKAEQHYSLAEFPEAVEEFKAAYRLVPRAGILFNLGQCYMQLQDYANAEFSYRAYLRASPEAANKQVVEELITQASAAAAERARVDAEAAATQRASSSTAALAAGLTSVSLGAAVGIVSLAGIALVEGLLLSDAGSEQARTGLFWSEKALGAAAAMGVGAVLVGGAVAATTFME